MDDDLLTTLKALSDVSRLRIAGLLAARPHTVEALGAAVGLAPGTIVHHLERLQAAGLVTARSSRPHVEYSLRVDRLHEVGRRIGDLERTTGETAAVPGTGGTPLPAVEARILRAFVVDGRLTSIPAQEKKRLVILRYVRERCFADDRPYPEKEVNARLVELHPDVASLRRHLVDAGLMARAGGVYRRA